jgi:tetratricopeptide (TPR) repeat protein
MSLQATTATKFAIGVSDSQQTAAEVLALVDARYPDQRKPAEAEAIYRQALAGYEKTLGPGHISTLNTVKNLGNLYSGWGKLAEAEAMYQRALAGYEKALGLEHMLTLEVVGNLGNLYSDQGKLAETEVMYQRALAGYEKTLGTAKVNAGYRPQPRQSLLYPGKASRGGGHVPTGASWV